VGSVRGYGRAGAVGAEGLQGGALAGWGARWFGLAGSVVGRPARGSVVGVRPALGCGPAGAGVRCAHGLR